MARARTLVLDTKVNVTGADKLNSLGRQFQKAGAALTLGVTTPLTLLAGAATNAASDLNESMNAINVVFGETSDEIAKIGETSAISPQHRSGRRAALVPVRAGRRDGAAAEVRD
jgi:hypothetical protein